MARTCAKSSFFIENNCAAASATATATQQVMSHDSSSKDFTLGIPKCNGEPLKFEQFERSLRTWALHRNLHLPLVMDGSGPFATMSYGGTMGVPLKFKDAHEKFFEDSSNVEEDVKHVGTGDGKEKSETDTAKMDGEQRMKQIHHDALCRDLDRCIDQNMGQNLRNEVLNAKIVPGNGSKVWKCTVEKVRGTRNFLHLDPFHKLLECKLSGGESLVAHNTKFNTFLSSLQTSLQMDDREKIKDLPGTVKVGICLKSLPENHD